MESFENVVRNNILFYYNQRTLTLLFSEDCAEINENMSQDDFEKLKSQIDLEKNIERVKLTKVLNEITKRK